MLVAGLVIAMQRHLSRLPDRSAQADALAELTFTPVRLSANGAVRIAGAWRVTSSERRLGGLSALAVDGDALIALSDSGVAIRLPKPGAMRSLALFRDLPGGPGGPNYKSGRDSEALARLADGDWLVAFEYRNQVWRYDRAFRAGRRVVRFTYQGWPANRGIEAMAVNRDGQLLVIPEGRGTLISIGDSVETRAVESGGWTASDATRMPDGRLFVLLRRITLTGFRNAIGELERTQAGWRVAIRADLPVGALDNAEGLAAEPMAAGGVRLWVVTDNDFAGYRRTLLLALDWPGPEGPAR